jgi:hypothetical protein
VSVRYVSPIVTYLLPLNTPLFLGVARVTNRVDKQSSGVRLVPQNTAATRSLISDKS